MDKELLEVLEKHKERISKINTPVDYSFFFEQTITTKVKKLRRKHKKKIRIIRIVQEKTTNTARYEFSKVKRTMEISECEQCGLVSPLCVHHIDKNKWNNNIENLMVLCYQCHRQKHPDLPDKLFK